MVTADASAKIKAFERKKRELKQANEIFKKARHVFGPSGARPQTEEIVQFIDTHRTLLGVEPIRRII